MDEQSLNLQTLQSMTPDFVKVVERLSTPAWQIREQVYAQHNLILVYDGVMVFETGGRRYSAVRGDLVYFPGGTRRKAVTVANRLMKCYAVDFFYACLHRFDTEWKISEPPLPFAPLERIGDQLLFSRLSALFQELTHTWLSHKFDRVNQCRNVFVEILSLLLLRNSGLDINYDKIRKVDRIVNHMTSNYQNPLSLEELARVNQISVSYMGKIFREVTGRTPIQYLTKIRIDKAKELLIDGHSVANTAVQVGFGDPSYFSRCFKREEGVSPGQFRLLSPR